jgi:hypothetical protein
MIDYSICSSYVNVLQSQMGVGSYICQPRKCVASNEDACSALQSMFVHEYWEERWGVKQLASEGPISRTNVVIPYGQLVATTFADGCD